jgi:hypothetical protein
VPEAEVVVVITPLLALVERVVVEMGQQLAMLETPVLLTQAVERVVLAEMLLLPARLEALEL